MEESKIDTIFEKLQNISDDFNDINILFKDKEDIIKSCFLNGKEIAFANKSELEKQMPLLKKKFLFAADFAKASLKDIFYASKLNSATKFTANYFSNALLISLVRYRLLHL